MKRHVLLTSALILLVALAACGPATPAANPTANPTAATGGQTPRKGGEMIIAYKDDLATLDPAVGYDWTNWPAEKLVFDGLLDYGTGDSGTTLRSLNV